MFLLSSGLSRFIRRDTFRCKKQQKEITEMLIAVRTIETREEDEDRETLNNSKMRKRMKRKHSGHKQLHGQFIRKTTSKAREDWWGWLKKRVLKKNNRSLNNGYTGTG